MQKLFSASAIGIFAEIIDVIPMLMRNIDKASCLSAFVHWLVLGVAISYVSASIPDWAKGGIIGIFSAPSIVIVIAGMDPKSIAPILITSLMLGAMPASPPGSFQPGQASRPEKDIGRRAIC